MMTNRFMNAAEERDSDPIALRFRTIAREQPLLREAVAVYETLLPVLRDAVYDVIPLAINSAEARASLAKGIPVLGDRKFEFDVDAHRELLIELARTVERTMNDSEPRGWRPLQRTVQKQSDTAAGRLRRSLEEDRLNIGSLLRHAVSGNQKAVTETALEFGLDPDLTWLLLQNSLKPALRVWNQQVAPWIAAVPWRKGICPVCGSAATMGELQGNNQEKHLRCGACGADWTFNRLMCACCGNEDHRTQRYLAPEGRAGRVRVDTCDRCKGYLKVIAAFSPTPAELVAIEDLATSSLDRIAQEQGYRRMMVPF